MLGSIESMSNRGVTLATLQLGLVALEGDIAESLVVELLVGRKTDLENEDLWDWGIERK
jgi:hypothetical protein